MLPRLILLFTLLPLIELYFIIEIGSKIGAMNTIIIILTTGIWGAHLARQQGLGILHEIQVTLQAGSFPGEQLIEGALILTGGAMLLTPGFLTDILGILVLVPASRMIFRRILVNYLRSRMTSDYDIYYRP